MDRWVKTAAIAASAAVLLAAAGCITQPRATPGTPLGSADGVAWSDQMEAGSGVTAIAIDPDGSVYAAGWTSAELSEGAGRGGRDAFLRKYTAAGEVVWTRQFGAGGDDIAEDIAIGPGGSVHVAARVDGPVDAGPSGGRDGYVAAFGPHGGQLWSLRIGTESVDWADAVAVTGDGTVLVSGSTAGTFPGQSNRGSSDNFLAIIDAGGNLSGLTQFGSEEGMGATALAFHDGVIYLAGSTLGPLSESPAGDEHAGSSDIFLRVFDLSGSELRTWTFGSNHADSALDLTIDDAGIVVVGTTRAVLPNPVVGIGSRAGGFLDAFAIGLNEDLEMVWVDQFGTRDWDVASGVARGAGGVTFIAGRTNGSLPGQASGGGYDSFIRALDSAGRVLWMRQWGSAADERALAVAEMPDGDLAVGGVGDIAGSGQGGPERGWVIRLRGPSEAGPGAP